MDFINQAKKAAAAMMQNAQNAIDQETIEVEGQFYKVTRKLGEGGFAFVYLVEDSQFRRYALKKMLCPDADKTAVAEKEIKVSKMLQQDGRHPNIVYLTASAKRSTERGSEILMLMEYCPGALSSLIEEGDLADDAILPIFRQICEGVCAMHRCNPPLAHRDIKAENVLRGADGVWKVCDFGSATTRSKAYTTKREIADEEERIQKYSTPQYKAPEMCDLYAGKVISEKVDVWALGVLLFLLTFRKHAFPDGNNIAIMGGNYSFPARKSDLNFNGHTRPQYLLDLIDFILKQDPDVRPSVSDVIARIDSILGRSSSGSTKSSAQAAPADDFFSNVGSSQSTSSDDFFSQAGSTFSAGADPFFASAASPTASSKEFFPSSGSVHSESATPKASTPKSSTPKTSSSKPSSIVSSAPGFGKCAPVSLAAAPAGPDLLDFGVEDATPISKLDDLLSAVGGAPPPSFVSPFQSSTMDDLFSAVPSPSSNPSNFDGFKAMSGSQSQPVMGHFGGIGGAQLGMYAQNSGLGGVQAMQMQMGGMQVGGMQGLAGQRSGIALHGNDGGMMGGGMMGGGMMGGGMIGGGMMGGGMMGGGMMGGGMVMGGGSMGGGSMGGGMMGMSSGLSSGTPVLGAPASMFARFFDAQAVVVSCGSLFAYLLLQKNLAATHPPPHPAAKTAIHLAPFP
jgi:serine/threonine protein kinase